MEITAERLLMMFIYDAYNMRDGKPSKRTAIAMMKYVAQDRELSRKITNGSKPEIITHLDQLKRNTE